MISYIYAIVNSKGALGTVHAFANYTISAYESMAFMQITDTPADLA